MKTILQLFVFILAFNCAYSDNIEFNYDDFNIKAKHVRIIGEELKIDMIATNSGATSDISFILSQIQAMNQSGSKLPFKYGTVGSQRGGIYSVVTTSMVRNVPINISLTFDLDGNEVENVRLFELPIHIIRGEKKFKVEIRNIPSNFRLSNPYPDSEKTMQFQAKSFLIDDDVTLSINDFKIFGEELRFEFSVENKSKKEFNCAFSVGNARIIDVLGDEYPVQSLKFGDSEGGIYNVVSKPVPYDFILQGNVSINHPALDDLNMIKLIEININKKPFYITNVGLSK